jgi:hypothetical protein
MKTEPKIGDYVGFKKPYVGHYLVGIIVNDIHKWALGIPGVDYTKPIYEIHTPSTDPRSPYTPIWRQAKDLKKSSYEKYVSQTVLKMLEL